MKTILGFCVFAVILLLGMLSLGVGQHVPEQWSVAVVETDCDSAQTICSPQESGCASTTFTPPTEGDYTFLANISCSGISTPCGGCYACAHIIRVSDSHDMGQIQTPCTEPCTGQIPVTLEKVQYRLFVCKKSCTNHDCSLCGSNCSATAKVY